MATEAIARRRTLTALPTPRAVREKAEAWRVARAQRSTGLKLAFALRKSATVDEVQPRRIGPVELAHALRPFERDLRFMDEEQQAAFRQALRLYLGGQMAQVQWSKIVCSLYDARASHGPASAFK